MDTHSLVHRLPLVGLLLAGLLLAGLLLVGTVASPGQAEEPPLQPVDRLVAVVDDDPVFLSDLERARILADGDEPREPTDRELLDRLVDRRLRLHEVDRYSEEPIPSSALEESLARLETRWGGPEELDRRLEQSGLDRDGLRELLRRQMRVLIHIEDRLGARVFVDEIEVRRYYDGELQQEMERQGRDLPPFEDVADDIRNVLRERALNREIEQWTRKLREAAKIVDLLDRPEAPDPLPPRVLRLEASEPGDG